MTFPKKHFLPTAAVAVLLLFLSAAASWAECGKERWPVKTLQDPDAYYVSREYKATNISNLRLAIPEKDIRAINPYERLDQERQTFIIHALLLGFKKENDEDYHLVIADPKQPALTMIAEIPSPECGNPIYAQSFSDARKVVETIAANAQTTVSDQYFKLPLPLSIVITGVFFFDFLHGQIGVAPNGAELHPVIDIHR